MGFLRSPLVKPKIAGICGSFSQQHMGISWVFHWGFDPSRCGGYPSRSQQPDVQLRWFPLKRQKSILVWEDWKRVVSSKSPGPCFSNFWKIDWQSSKLCWLGMVQYLLSTKNRVWWSHIQKISSPVWTTGTLAQGDRWMSKGTGPNCVLRGQVQPKWHELLEKNGRIHDLEYESLYYIYIVYKLYI